MRAERNNLKTITKQEYIVSMYLYGLLCRKKVPLSIWVLAVTRLSTRTFNEINFFCKKPFMVEMQLRLFISGAFLSYLAHKKTNPDRILIG